MTVPSSPSAKTYNGNSQNHGITVPTNTSIVTASSTTSATNAGTYNVVFKLDDTSNYQWNDGTTANKTVSWTINQAKTATTGSCNSLTYNGSAQTLAAGGSYVSYSNNSKTEA